MSLNETLKTLKSEFDSLEDDFSKYEYLTELAALLPKESTALRQEENLFRGCQSQVWIIKERQSLYNLWNRCYTAYRPIKTKVKKFARFDG